MISAVLITVGVLTFVFGVLFKGPFRGRPTTDQAGARKTRLGHISLALCALGVLAGLVGI